MSFSELLRAVTAWVTEHRPAVIGGAVAFVVLVALLVVVNRRRRLDPAKLTGAGSPAAVDHEKAAHWAPPEQSYADRRGAVRRDGQPVRVLLASPNLRGGADEGYVLDRSTGGLRVATAAAVAPGTALQARAANAPDTVGYVTLLVRSCRRNGDHFELGCEFEKTPPWNVLLLFG
ncbi:MAG: hypothetical protein C0501_02970 [Isosphaera sp.]|nr:hypothetical protein [Isosphaera sp.]